MNMMGVTLEIYYLMQKSGVTYVLEAADGHTVARSAVLGASDRRPYEFSVAGETFDVRRVAHLRVQGDSVYIHLLPEEHIYP